MDDKGIINLLNNELKNKSTYDIAKEISATGSEITAAFISAVSREKSKPSEKIYNYFGYTKVCKLEKLKK